jgi:mannose-1-phosphate guanylyltransferase
MPGPTGESLRLPGAVVADDARVSGGTTVGARVDIGAGAVVDGSVLLDDAVIGAGATVRDSFVGRGARVGDGVHLAGAVVGDGAEVCEGNELVAGARVWVDARIPPYTIRFTPDEPST